MKYDFGIRVDMGNEIGAGHFYRCLSLANELIGRGKDVVFIVKNEKEFSSHIGNNSVPYFVIGNKNEIKTTKLFLNSVRSLIFDLPTKNELYGKSFYRLCKTATIDDLGGINVFSNYLFNGSIVRGYHKYKKYNKNSLIYLGPKYMILRRDFLKNRKKYSVSKNIKRVLLTFGGTDELGLTQKFTKHFSKKNFAVTVILGPSYRGGKSLSTFSNKFPNIKFNTAIQNIASLFIKHDIIISSSGITSYELASLGIPTILIPADSQQIHTAIQMERSGCAVNYGFWDNNFERFDSILHDLNNYRLRKEMYQNGRRMVDGKGCLRVAKHLIDLI